jgi:hypothetical protein
VKARQRLLVLDNYASFDTKHGLRQTLFNKIHMFCEAHEIGSAAGRVGLSRK